MTAVPARRTEIVTVREPSCVRRTPFRRGGHVETYNTRRFGRVRKPHGKRSDGTRRYAKLKKATTITHYNDNNNNINNNAINNDNMRSILNFAHFVRVRVEVLVDYTHDVV